MSDKVIDFSKCRSDREKCKQAKQRLLAALEAELAKYEKKPEGEK